MRSFSNLIQILMLLGLLFLLSGCSDSSDRKVIDARGSSENAGAARQTPPDDTPPHDSVLRPNYVDHSTLTEAQSIRQVMSGMGFSAVGEGMRLMLAEDILFEPGKADLKPEARQELNELRPVLEHFDTEPIKVLGYSDKDEQAGRTLARRRAETVRNYLISNLQAEPDRFIVQALGPKDLQQIDKTAIPGANRRVEVIIVTSADENQANE